jgi:hypothetical protein
MPGYLQRLLAMVGYAFIRFRVEGDTMGHFKAVLRQGRFFSLSWWSSCLGSSRNWRDWKKGEVFT